MLLRTLPGAGVGCARCSTPFRKLVKHLGPEVLLTFNYQGTAREYSVNGNRTSDGILPNSFESLEFNSTPQKLENTDISHGLHRETTTNNNSQTEIYHVVKDPSQSDTDLTVDQVVKDPRFDVPNDQWAETSKKLQQASNVHYEIFTKFLEQVEADGYIAYRKPSIHEASTHKIPAQSKVALEGNSETNSSFTSMILDPNAEGQDQELEESPEAGQQIVEHTNVYESQKATDRSVITGQKMVLSPRIDQSVNICLHLDDRVRQEIDRILTKFSQHRPVLNPGRANIPILKGLPAQHWRQYHILMRSLQLWRPPIAMARQKPLIIRQGKRWGVVWQIENYPDIQAFRQTLRQMLEDDLSQYDFPPDNLWKTRVTITHNISRARAEEIVDLINTAYPEGFDLGPITRCVLLHTVFSYGKIRTTVTESPEFPLMGVQSVLNSTSQRSHIDTLWKEITSKIDTAFYKATWPNKFYKTGPIRKIKEGKKKNNNKDNSSSNVAG